MCKTVHCFNWKPLLSYPCVRNRYTQILSSVLGPKCVHTVKNTHNEHVHIIAGNWPSMQKISYSFSTRTFPVRSWFRRTIVSSSIAHVFQMCYSLLFHFIWLLQTRKIVCFSCCLPLCWAMKIWCTASECWFLRKRWISALPFRLHLLFVSLASVTIVIR